MHCAPTFRLNLDSPLIRGCFGHRFGIIFIQFVQQQCVIGPHVAGEGMIFSITERDRRAALAMGWKPEADGIALHLNPEMAAGGACSPAQQDERIVLVKSASSFERIGVEGFEHLGKSALSQDTLGILPHSLTPRFISLVTQNILKVFLVLARSVGSFNRLFARTRTLPGARRQLRGLNGGANGRQQTGTEVAIQ
jgi:hypothetical protein